MTLNFFPVTILLLNVDCFEEVLNQCKIDGMANDNSSSFTEKPSTITVTLNYIIWSHVTQLYI